MTTLFVLLLLCLGQDGSPQRPPSSEQTAEIRGRVTDKDTGTPLPFAQIEIWERTRKLTRSTLTDDAGVFRFRGLPPGRYSGIAAPGSHRAGYQYESLVKIEAGQVRDLELAKGEIKELNVALRRTVTIPVRVVDAFGEPLSGVRLSASNSETGLPVPVPFQHTTDDHGHLRLFGLEAGRYIVCADGSSIGTGSSSGAQVREGLLRTCYPSAEDEQHAEGVTVGTEPVDEIEIRMRRGRTYTMAGTVLDSAGMPANGVRLQLELEQPGGSSSMGITIKDDGRFRIENVHPGTYALTASLGGPEQPEQPRSLERAYVAVRVDADVDNIAVMLSKTVSVEGQMVLEDPALPFPGSEGSGLMLSLRLVDDPLEVSGSRVYGYARNDHTFTVEGAFGRRVVRVDNVPRGWFVKQVQYRGKDILDSVVDFSRASEGRMNVVLSNRGASVTGRVTDDDGKPAARAHVWLFQGVPDARRGIAGEVRTSATGEFTLTPLRAGDYTLVAFASPPRQLKPSDRERAAKLAELGERITVAELDQRSIDLRIVKEVPR